MPLNIPGLLAPFQLLWNPRVVLPHVVVADIRQLDFLALRKAGYRGAVFDKDNCLTIPYKDSLVPELQGAWKECREAFGEGNVLIVSNSAGTRDDPGGIQAESVSYYLSAPVLQHNSLKPAYACISGIRPYFSSLRNPIKDDELVVVGDRIFTDVVMANRMRRRAVPKPEEPKREDEMSLRERAKGPLAVWTSGVWQKESMAMRYFERQLVDAICRWTDSSSHLAEYQKAFTKPLPAPEVDK
ncbi:HAD phosphatase, partial [Scleroderma citrinum]